jgi:hypothetical protein
MESWHHHKLEALAMLHRLTIIKNNGINKVKVIGDSMVVIRVLHNDALLTSLPLARVCQQIIVIVMEFNSIEFYHILCSLNFEVNSKVNASVLLDECVLSIKVG